MAYILVDKKAIFFHIPKTGGLSVIKYLLDHTPGVMCS